MLELRLLHQALTLARHRNFARAAQALHLTQPALSRSIAGLETTLGERLFDRSRRGVEPTAFGQMLLARAQPLVDAATELERDFRLLRGLQIGELRVGAGAYAVELSVSQAVGRLMARHPDLQVELASHDFAVKVIDSPDHMPDTGPLPLIAILPPGTPPYPPSRHRVTLSWPVQLQALQRAARRTATPATRAQH